MENLNSGELREEAGGRTNERSELHTKIGEIIGSLQYWLQNGGSEEQRLYFAKEIKELEHILNNDNMAIKLRNIQKKALRALIKLMKQGLYEGYIKLPTGAGKTILFALIVAAFEQGTIIMVPTRELVLQTAEVFIEDVGYDLEDIKVINTEEEGAVNGIVTRIIEEIGDKEFSGIIISTHSGLKSLYKRSPELLAKLRDKVGMYVTDEAHTALGEVHLDMQENGLNIGDVKKLHLLFTATPKLTNKHLKDHYEEIIDIKLSEGVEDGILVLPQFQGVGPAYLNVDEEKSSYITQDFLDKHSLKFVDNKGKPIYEGLTEKYLEIKHNASYGYAPGIAVCATIEQAEFIKNYLISKGVRAIRVTSANTEYDEGTDSHLAKQMIQRNETDVVVTVRKVGLGWDVPTLRNIIRYYPTLSEANLIQPFGRILRALEPHHIDTIIKRMEEKEGKEFSHNYKLMLKSMLQKSKENTNLIEPDTWEVRYQLHKEGGPNEPQDPHKEGNGNRFNNIMNTIQALYDAGELSWEDVHGHYPNVQLTQRLTKELIKETFDKLGGYKKLIKYRTEDIKKLEISGKKIWGIAAEYGFKSKYNLSESTQIGFQEFISFIYNKEFIYKVPTKDQIKIEMDALGGYEILKNYTANQITGNKNKEIPALEIKGAKIGALATICGFQSKYAFSLGTPSHFQEFLAFLYEKEYLPNLTQEEIRKGLDNLGGYDKLIKYSKDDIIGNFKKGIKGIDIKGNKIRGIISTYGFQSKYGFHLQSALCFQEFISHVYGKKFVYEKNDLSKEEIKEYFDNLGGYDKLMAYTGKQIKGYKNEIIGINLKKKGIIAIAKAYGFKSKYNLKAIEPTGFQEFISYIYDKEFSIALTKTNIKDYFDNLGGYDVLKEYTGEQIRKLELNGKKIISIMHDYGFQSKYGLNRAQFAGFQEFISYIYGKEYIYIKKEKIVLKPKEIKRQLDELGGYDKLIKYTNSDIKKLEIKGNKIVKIMTLYGFKSKYNLHPQTESGYQEFISYIYDKEFKYIQQQRDVISPEEIRNHFDEIGYDILSRYSAKQIKNIIIKGNKLYAIASAYGFESKYDLSIETEEGFKEFISFIYGKVYSPPKQITNKDIKDYFDNLGGYDKLINYDKTQIEGISVGGKKISNLGSIYGFQSKYKLKKPTISWFQEFVSHMYGREFNYKEKKAISKNEIKEYFDNLGGYDYFVNYNVKDIQNIEIKGHKIISIANTYYGFKKHSNNQLKSPIGFRAFLMFIYKKND